MTERRAMNESTGKPDQEQGLYRKYHVERLNDKTGKHANCLYYVLDLDHDKHSAAALLAYADSCEADYPTLAFDLRHTAAATARKLGVSLNERRDEAPRPFVFERNTIMDADGKAYTPEELVAALNGLRSAPPPSQQAVRGDTTRLEWLAALLRACPHSEISYNDDPDEGPVGYSIIVEGCSRMEVRAPTLEACIDLAIDAKQDEDGNIIAAAPTQGNEDQA